MPNASYLHNPDFMDWRYRSAECLGIEAAAQMVGQTSSLISRILVLLA